MPVTEMPFLLQFANEYREADNFIRMQQQREKRKNPQC